METSKPPLMTSESTLYNSSAGPKTNASNPILNNTDGIKAIKTDDIVYISLISCTEIPMICLAIYAVYFLIKSNQATPVFLINLLISDIILIVSMLLRAISFNRIMFYTSLIGMHWSGFTGAYLMTCISVERYVVIAHPVWHRSHHSVKCLVYISLIGLLLSIIVFLTIDVKSDLLHFMAFIPYPVIILCFVGACRSLSRSISLTPLKRQLVLSPLLFVVISYTFLFLPVNILGILVTKFSHSQKLARLAFNLYLLNPLVDCLLYVFMRSDAENIIRMPHCCTRLKRVQSETGHTTSTDVQHSHV
ncbi:ovarian cancer G-protein coupled receptor 1-like [Rhinichthys klamathensis goyatoka]|uniref:ovarian cancer G-protein coupled receptor 1-like n=1 Tax=Rhinichthys klamathensis goyatoka TaxID=3034132 RepID=UPI0024B51925|nr:ovarian cancer G-protein coupled receptor 1-like [Rhinichthys klamathensis goyatoka]